MCFCGDPECWSCGVAQDTMDPFGGTPENWSLPGREWPPSDPDEMARLGEWCDRMEAEMAARE